MANIGYIIPSNKTRPIQPDGSWNPIWYLFLCSLFNSAGGGTPVTPGGGGSVTDDVAALQAYSDALTYTPPPQPMLTDSSGVTWRFVYGTGWVVA